MLVHKAIKRRVYLLAASRSSDRSRLRIKVRRGSIVIAVLCDWCCRGLCRIDLLLVRFGGWVISSASVPSTGILE